MYCIRHVYSLIRKRIWLVMTTVFSKKKDFSKSQAVTFTVNAVISQKLCNMESLLQTNNRTSCMAHRIAAVPMTLNDLHVLGRHYNLQYITRRILLCYFLVSVTTTGEARFFFMVGQASLASRLAPGLLLRRVAFVNVY